MKSFAELMESDGDDGDDGETKKPGDELESYHIEEAIRMTAEVREMSICVLL